MFYIKKILIDLKKKRKVYIDENYFYKFKIINLINYLIYKKKLNNYIYVDKNFDIKNTLINKKIKFIIFYDDSLFKNKNYCLIYLKKYNKKIIKNEIVYIFKCLLKLYNIYKKKYYKIIIFKYYNFIINILTFLEKIKKINNIFNFISIMKKNRSMNINFFYFLSYDEIKSKIINIYYRNNNIKILKILKFIYKKDFLYKKIKNKIIKNSIKYQILRKYENSNIFIRRR
ncbi:hypothetical protein [Candidatus Vidania fulgoroideorum]